jgi:hypothetical protein
VLLSDPTHYLEGLVEGRWDLVGIEERIRETPDTDWRRIAPQYNGWMRFAPGVMDATFLMFNLREFLRKWGLRGIKGRPPRGSLECEYHYGICEKLKRHKYLLPYHTRKYGWGNLIKDGETPVLWHQWYGSYRARIGGTQFEPTLRGTNETIAIVQRGEEAFLADYPNLDFSNLTPAWGPDRDIGQERLAVANSFPTFSARWLNRIRRWKSYGPRDLAHRLLVRIDRWRRLYLN